MKQTLLGIFIFGLGITTAVGGYVWRQQKARVHVELPANGKPVPLPANNFLVELAPRESVRGKIASTAGEVNWQSRMATEPALLDSPVMLDTVQQGEKFVTGKGGKTTIVFDNYGEITLNEETSVEIVQTLPVNFVFNQSSGEADYTMTGETPISIRSPRLLINLESGKLLFKIDPKTGRINVKLERGLATAAYNDEKFVSQVQAVKAGETFSFNNEQRSGKVISN